MARLYILDGHHFLYRLFHAVPEFTTSDGRVVNAVFGLARVLFRILREERPDGLVVVFDSRKNFRTDISPDYKGTRDRMPDNLRVQESLLLQLLGVLGIRVLSVDGYEADDIIGTLATQCQKSGIEIRILSSDKDLFQFVWDGVRIYDPMKSQIFGYADAEKKFGVAPEFIVDFLSLVGDSSDNIPGVPGIGPKKAAVLIGEYGSLENIYANLDDIPGKTRDMLAAYEAQAFLSKRLATIDVRVPVSCELSDYAAPGPEATESAETIAFLESLEFRSLIPGDRVSSLADFASLGIAVREIDARIIAHIRQSAHEKSHIALATWGNGLSLSGVVVMTAPQTAYTATPENPRFSEMIDLLLGYDRLVGYDLKSDLRRLEAWRVWEENDMSTR